MTKKIIVLMGIIGIFAYAVYAQQPPDPHEGHSHEKPTPANEKPAPVSEKPGEQSSPNNSQKPKYGTVKANGSPLSFMNKGEGTLKFSGQGVILISDLNGSLQVQGFKELKQLPKGVTIKSPMDKRIRLFQGQGSITIKGKYGSVRVKLRHGQMEFVGSGSLNIDGKGKYVYDGKEGNLINIGTMTFFVPTPDWMKQQVKEADQLIAPKGRRGEIK
jgi:hypothetical protein